MEVAIVGAGIMGRMLAWTLLQRGHAVHVFDRDAQNHGNAAAYTAAGMLAPYGELFASEPRLWQMGMDSLPRWRRLASLLGAESLGYRPAGSLTLAHAQDRAEWQHQWRRLLRCLPGEASAHFQHWGGEQLARHESSLASRFSEALYFPSEAWLDNRKTLQRLGEALLEAGGQWHANTLVEDLKPHSLMLDKKHIFDWVVDCRGMGARAELPTLRGVRGELLQVEARGVPIDHLLRLLHPRQSLYLVPQQGGRYLLGATQIESADDSPVSVRSAMTLLNALYSIHPGFAEARILDWRVGCRPALPDNLPRIHVQPGLLRINGLFRHGFLLAPLLADEVADYMQNKNESLFKYQELIRKYDEENHSNQRTL